MVVLEANDFKCRIIREEKFWGYFIYYVPVK
jgi:hypothetical protein